MTSSRHYLEERKRREELIQTIGEGTIIKTVFTYRNTNLIGERHEISSTGIVTIYSLKSGRIVTKLIARPNQIKRYWGEEKAPKELLDIAYYHKRMGYNKI